MGEARKRGSKPSALEKARRFGVRTWYLYPKPLRAVIKFEAEVYLWAAGILGALILGAVVLEVWHHYG